MFRTPCILAAFLMALVVLPAATLVSVSDIPGLDKAESPEVQEVLKKVWALQKAAPRTAHMKMHGTALGIKVQTEVWLGSGDIVAKTVNPDGTSMVEGMIGDTAFKVHDGKSMPMNEKQKLNQYLHAHPRMAMDMLFHAAKKITFSRGHEYGKKVNELMLHGVSSFGDIEIQFYEDGTIASNLTPMHGGMAKVINFGEYSRCPGSPHPPRDRHVDRSSRQGRGMVDAGRIKSSPGQDGGGVSRGQHAHSCRDLHPLALDAQGHVVQKGLPRLVSRGKPRIIKRKGTTLSQPLRWPARFLTPSHREKRTWPLAGP